MAFYWLGEAIKEAEKLEDNEIVTEGEPVKPEVFKSPTIIGSEEQISYITSQLNLFSKQIDQYKREFQLPPQVEYNLNRGYDNLKESIFNMTIAKTYYDQTQRSNGGR